MCYVTYTRGATCTVCSYPWGLPQVPVWLQGSTDDAYLGGCGSSDSLFSLNRVTVYVRGDRPFQALTSPGHSGPPTCSPAQQELAQQELSASKGLPGLQLMLSCQTPLLSTDGCAADTPLWSKPISLPRRLASLSTWVSAVVFPTSVFLKLCKVL